MALPAFIDSWSAIYSNSAALRSAIGFAHVGGLVGGGGAAIAADRAVLRIHREGPERRPHHLATIHHTHWAVLIGLSLVVVSGLLLLGADLESYLESTVFWIKMGLVLLLFANGVILLTAEQGAATGDERRWRHLHRASVASLVLWFATTLAGVVLPNAL